MKTLILAAAAVLALSLATADLTAEQRADVKSVQQTLAQAGHDPGAIDGVLGPKTSAALRAYQKANGLGETGRLDEATLAALQPSGGGDTKPSAADPAQAQKTGANVGEGASYNRSTEKK
jgi:peptidoglycan hydrolase-like protein with peptidoglycan-binding domain